MKWIISISGVTEPSAIKKLSLIRPQKHELYMGMLITTKLIKKKRAKKKKKSSRYICLDELRLCSEVVRELSGVSCIAHYCLTHDKSEDQNLPLRSLKILDSGCSGIQFNAPIWPHWRGIELVKERYIDKKMILQLNDMLIKECKNDFEAVGKKLARYSDGLDYVLIDQSSGKGKPFDPVLTAHFIKILRKHSSIPFGLAGGFGKGNFNDHRSFIEDYDIVLIDAEKNLMRPSGGISISKAAKYIEKMS